MEESNERVNEGDREDRECCSDEILADLVSTIVEVPLLILTHTKHRGRQITQLANPLYLHSHLFKIGPDHETVQISCNLVTRTI